MARLAQNRTKRGLGGGMSPARWSVSTVASFMSYLARSLGATHSEASNSSLKADLGVRCLTAKDEKDHIDGLAPAVWIELLANGVLEIEAARSW